MTLVAPTMLILLSADADPYRGFNQMDSAKTPCCGGTDCKRLPDNEVKAVPGGYQVAGWGFVPNVKAQPGFDQHYHLCGDVNQFEKSLYCFLTPSPGM
jgi:hypothetical protein